MSTPTIQLSRLASITNLKYNNDFYLLSSEQGQWELEKPYWLNDLMIAIILEQGAISMTINGVSRFNNTGSGILYLLNGSNFVVHSVSEDFKARYIVMSSHFLVRLCLNSDLSLNYDLRGNPFLPLPQEGVEGILNVYNMYVALLRLTNNPHIFRIIQHITQACFLTYDYYFHSQTATSYITREQELVKNFLHQLDFHYKQEHSVNYYADLLHVSPKHMSRCVRQEIGMSAKQCIVRHLLSAAQSMLASGTKTAVEVSIELGFPDPSTFGKFFRLQTNMTPKEWCEHCNE